MCSQKWRKKNKEQGLCGLCGKQPFAKTSVFYCQTCLDKRKKQLKERQERLKRLGLCRNCGKPVAIKKDGTLYLQCSDCLKKLRHRAVKYHSPNHGQPCAICHDFAEIVNTHHLPDGSTIPLCPNHHAMIHKGMIELPL